MLKDATERCCPSARALPVSQMSEVSVDMSAVPRVRSIKASTASVETSQLPFVDASGVKTEFQPNLRACSGKSEERVMLRGLLPP